MLCGSTCFRVKLDLFGETKTKSVIAQTPIKARKTVRNQYGQAVEIISVRKKKMT